MGALSGDRRCAGAPIGPAAPALVAFIAAIALTVGCGDDPAAPRAVDSIGEVVVRLVTPHEDDRAVMLRITGPVREVRAASGFTALVRASGSTTTVVLVRDSGGSIPTDGTGLALVTPGALDTEYRIELIEVAARSHAVRSSLDGYRLEIVEDGS